MVRRGMTNGILGAAVILATLAPGTTWAQAPVDSARPATAPGEQKVGQTGNLDPGVNFVNVVENAHVRVLQINLQAGSVRRPHIHNDVLFSIVVPVTGALELTVDKDPVVTAVPGQAYYSAKGQTHSFVNKTSGAVQIVEIFVKTDVAPTPPTPAAAK